MTEETTRELEVMRLVVETLEVMPPEKRMAALVSVHLMLGLATAEELPGGGWLVRKVHSHA